MIAFKDCEYSLFISYAHADDAAENGWVQSLRTAILHRLELLDDDIPKKGLHFSQEDGPAAGSLASKLKDRVARSFGMLLVVGEKYVQSRWCEEELKYFVDTFGVEGARSRLYIAAMSQAAVDEAKRGETWQRVVRDDQLWVPMFQTIDRNAPLPHRMGNGDPGFPGEFFSRASKLADALIEQIELDHADSKRHVPPPGPARTADTGITTPAQPGQRKQIAIGPGTPSLADAVQRAQAALDAAGAQTSLIDAEAVLTCDPDDGSPLRALLTGADVLVVPATLETPIAPNTDGGHAAVLRREWLAAGKAERDLVFYRPADVVVPPEKLAKERHQKVFEQLAPVCFNETALVSHLFGLGNVPAIRVHIENHPQAHAFKRLALQLEDAWNALDPDPNRPMLRCVSLDLDDLANASKDVAGVVLLLPVPLKDPRALLAQIDQVQRMIPKSGTYPGCVAVLYSPPLGAEVPRHEWPYVQLRKSEQEPKLTIEDDSRVELEEFLNDLWERYKRSQPKVSP